MVLARRWWHGYSNMPRSFFLNHFGTLIPKQMSIKMNLKNILRTPLRWVLVIVSFWGLPATGFAQNLEVLSGVLDPEDASFETKRLGKGVYALVNQVTFSDNSGFVVGEKGVLVIDSHIHGIVADKIIAAVREVTDKPILYLVNTSHNGDHWFGNYAFPAETKIIAHQATAHLMATRFERLRENIKVPFVKDPSLLDQVEARLPDVILDGAQMDIDLGGIQVQIYHFGYGNSPGDLVVYAPSAHVAWTGNFMLGEGIVPLLIGQARIPRYLDAVARFSETLEAKTIVPGHGGLTSEREAVPLYMGYLSELLQVAAHAVETGLTEEEVTGAFSEAFRTKYTDGPYRDFLTVFHFINLRNVYQLLHQEQDAS